MKNKIIDCRSAVCCRCGREWVIAKSQEIGKQGYVCPRCAKKQKNNLRRGVITACALACALSGFCIGLLEVEQEAEAALLPNPPSPVIEIQPVEPQKPVKLYTEADVDMLAKLIYTEAREVASTTEQAAVVCDRRESSERSEQEVVLNRLDNPDRPESSIAEVVCAPYQFDYRPWVPVTPEFKALAEDVLDRWQAEKNGAEDVGRTLPAEYQYFEGDGERNWFSVKWKSDEYWDWSLDSPYED